MALPHAEEFRRDADDARPSLGTRLVSVAILLEHIAQTQEIPRGSCMELSQELIGLADEQGLRARLTVIRGSFARSGFGPPAPPTAPAAAAAGSGCETTEATAIYAVPE